MSLTIATFPTGAIMLLSFGKKAVRLFTYFIFTATAGKPGVSSRFQTKMGVLDLNSIPDNTNWNLLRDATPE
jgi:hypothetical protein